MLFDTPPRSLEKRLCLLLRDEPFRQVVAVLLEQWGYTVLEAPTDSEMILAEEGCPVPEESGPVLWLTRSRYGERNRIPLPLSVEGLWSTLENRFHKPPRSHIRIGLVLPATVHVRDEVVDTAVSSLSDLGARFDFHRELVQGEELLLHLTVSGRPLALEGRVIYVIPHGDLDGSARTRVGVIFDRLPQEGREELRTFIVRTYLERVRARLDGSTFRKGLAHFDVPLALAAELGCG